MRIPPNRVLLANASRNFRKAVKSMLDESCEVHEVEDGESLAQALTLLAYDLVITDLSLPFAKSSSGNAPRVPCDLSQLKTWEVPVMVIAAKEDNIEAVQQVQRTVNVKSMLFTPVDLELLRSRVEAILSPNPPAAEGSFNMLRPFSYELRRALVIDEDPEVRDLLTLYLEPDGIQIRTCATFNTAQRLFQKYSFDLILMGIRSEGKTADALMARLLEQGSGKKIPPMVLMCGSENRLEVERCRRQEGVVGLLRKPIRADDLLALFKRRYKAEAAPAEVATMNYAPRAKVPAASLAASS